MGTCFSADVPLAQRAAQPLHEAPPVAPVAGDSKCRVDTADVAADLAAGNAAQEAVDEDANAMMQRILLANATNSTTHSGVSQLKQLSSLVRTVALTDSAIELQDPEDLFEDVELQYVVGRGAFGVVFRGQYQGADAAVKFLAAESADNSHLCEALLSSQLHHPNVVHTFTARATLLTESIVRRIYEEGGMGGAMRPQATTSTQPPPVQRRDSGDGLGDPRRQTAGQHAWSEVFAQLAVKQGQVLVMLVQDFCIMGSLAGALQRGILKAQPPRVSERVARRMVLRTATEICRGMISLHAANVVHGDLKPANILLAPSRNDRRGFIVKVADFGLSRTLGDSRSWTETSNPGTLAYCSPEAIEGQQARGSDVYSFGVMLFDLMTGKRPFHNLTVPQIMMGVCCEGLRPDWPEEQWPELCAIAKRCCASDRSQRPSFRQLERKLMELEAALRGDGQQRAGLSPRPPVTPGGTSHGGEAAAEPSSSAAPYGTGPSDGAAAPASAAPAFPRGGSVLP